MGQTQNKVRLYEFYYSVHIKERKFVVKSLVGEVFRRRVLVFTTVIWAHPRTEKKNDGTKFAYYIRAPMNLTALLFYTSTPHPMTTPSD